LIKTNVLEEDERELQTDVLFLDSEPLWVAFEKDFEYAKAKKWISVNILVQVLTSIVLVYTCFELALLEGYVHNFGNVKLTAVFFIYTDVETGQTDYIFFAQFVPFFNKFYE
jgi:hypothetical protein